jgi:hypothetical protein
MHQNCFEGDEKLGDECAILAKNKNKMQTTRRIWAKHHFSFED